MSDNRHEWSNPDENGVKACTRQGCTVRVFHPNHVWQRKVRGLWRDLSSLPACADGPQQKPSKEGG